MEKVKSLRTIAAETGEMRYAMTKPCKRGHIGERYTSCGLCCDCVIANQQEIKNKLLAGQRLANTKLYEPARVYSVVARPAHHSILADAAHICSQGNDDQIDRLTSLVSMIFGELPHDPAMPRPVGELTRTALAAAACLDAPRVAYTDGTPLRERQSSTGRVYVGVGLFWYDAVRLLALWRNERMNVQPADDKEMQ